MTKITPKASRPSLHHPGVLLATWFGSGYLPKAPGTWGSIAALPLAWVIMKFGGVWVLGSASVLVFCVGLWASKDYMERTNSHDPGPVVIDEVAGQWIVLLMSPLDPVYYMLSFVLFRLFDIFKPWPISWVDESVSGAWGVMLDDVLAGVFGLGTLYVIIIYGAPYLGGLI